jgi:organic hydroperoxide reductase OsmC/OhrA
VIGLYRSWCARSISWRRATVGVGAIVAAASVGKGFGGRFQESLTHLVCEAAVPGIDAAAFAKHAEAAKSGCPVSQVLAGTTITLDAKLAR